MFHFLPPIHKEGYLFVAVFALASLGLFCLGLFYFPWATPLGWVGAVLTIWCGLFFRDPARVVPQQEDVWVAPADGVICAIGKASLPEKIARGESVEYMRVSVFMNVFNCHINRAAFAGKVEHIDYVAGAFFNASWDKASLENERQYLTLRSSDGERFVITQIAGLVARRIVCWVKIGDELALGERFGMIRFGSRVDVYLPPHSRVIAEIGQTMIGGETIIARREQ